MPDILVQTPVSIGPYFEVSPYCREEVNLERGHEYPAGLVLGKITGSEVFAPHDPTANDGREIVAGIQVWRLRADDTLPPDGPEIRSVAVVRGPVVIGAGQLVRHPDINDAAAIAEHDAALLGIGILVKAQV